MASRRIPATPFKMIRRMHAGWAWRCRQSIRRDVEADIGWRGADLSWPGRRFDCCGDSEDRVHLRLREQVRVVTPLRAFVSYSMSSVSAAQ
jgi:hypothetical protein